MEITVNMVKANNKVYEEIRQEILSNVKESAGEINSKLDDCIARLECAIDNLAVLRTHYFEDGEMQNNRRFDNAFYLPEVMLTNISEALNEINCYDVLK